MINKSKAIAKFLLKKYYAPFHIISNALHCLPLVHVLRKQKHKIPNLD